MRYGVRDRRRRRRGIYGEVGVGCGVWDGGYVADMPLLLLVYILCL